MLAEGSNAQGNFLFATDFHNNKIDVFDKNFNKVTLGQNGWGTFTDSNAPAGFAPFGVKDIDGTIFVSYAKQKGPDNHDDQEGPGNGFIDRFDNTGHFLGRFASGSAAGGTAPLNSPIGMAVAPPGYGPNGKFGGALLVGNFGDSHVSAFDLKTGAFLGQLSDAQGNPLTLNGGVGGSGTKGLWGIGFGNGHGGADVNTLFFAAGVNNEADGLFGKVTMTRDDRGGDRGHDHGDGAGGDEGHDRRGLDSASAIFSNPSVVGSLNRSLLADLGGFLGTTGSTPAQTGTQPTSQQSLSVNTGTNAFSAQVLHRKMIDQVFGELAANSAL